MRGFVQRYPFAPKAIWWKKYEEIDSVNFRNITIKNIEKNKYIRMFAFDCVKEDAEQYSEYRPLQGLEVNNGYVNIRTHNFSGVKQIPKVGDIMEYIGKFWIIDDVSKINSYTPREKSIFTFSLKALL